MEEDTKLRKSRIDFVDSKTESPHERHLKVWGLLDGEDLSNHDINCFVSIWLAMQGKQGLFPELTLPLSKSIYFAHYLHAEKLGLIPSNINSDDIPKRQDNSNKIQGLLRNSIEQPD